MKLPYSKPFRDIAFNIETLKSRGMVFADEIYAKQCLARIGYYRLSAYWYPFREFCACDNGGSAVRCDHFVPDTHFKQVLDFYFFDKELRLLISDALERIEIAMRTFLVETLGKYGAHAHRNDRSYRNRFKKINVVTGKSDMEKFLDGLDGAFAASKEDFAEHFKKHYFDHPPIWIAVEGWMWGNLSYIFIHLSEQNMNKICAMIDPVLKRKTLISWMACLNEVRNACAHHSRLWNKTIVNPPKFQKFGEFTDFDHIRTNHGEINHHYSTRLYGALLVIVFLMKRLHPQTKWHQRLAQKIGDMTFPKEISINRAGFPENWREALIWV